MKIIRFVTALQIGLMLMCGCGSSIGPTTARVDINSLSRRIERRDAGIDSRSLVIEVNTSIFDEYLDAMARGISEPEYRAHFAKYVPNSPPEIVRETVDSIEREAEPKAAITVAEQQTYQAELIHSLRLKFPNAVVIGTHQSIADRAAVKSMFNAPDIGVHPDIFIVLFVTPDLKPSDVTPTTGNYGRYFSPNIFMQTAGEYSKFFDTGENGRQVRQQMIEYRREYGTPTSASQISNLAAQFDANPSAFLGDIEWNRKLYSDYDSITELQKAQCVLGTAYARDFPNKAHWESFEASARSLQSYSGDPETSPLKPLYQWCGAELTEYAATSDVDQLRLDTFRNWGSFYEPDESKLSSVRVAWLDNPLLAPKRIRTLLNIRKAENKFLIKTTDLTIIQPAAGKAGDLVRNMLRQQEELQSAYQSQQAIADMTQFLGIGLEIGSAFIKNDGARQLTQIAGQGSLDLSQASLIAAVGIDKQSQEASREIAAAIGPVTVEIDGEQHQFLAENYQDLRNKIRKVYQAHRGKTGTAASITPAT